MNEYSHYPIKGMLSTRTSVQRLIEVSNTQVGHAIVQAWRQTTAERWRPTNLLCCHILPKARTSEHHV